MFSIVIPVGLGRDATHALGSLEHSGISGEDEVILVGDGYLPEVVGEVYNYPVQVYSTLTTMGANAARNFGADKASQPFLCFLDDDDEHLPDCLHFLRSHLVVEPAVQVWSLGWKMLSGREMPSVRKTQWLNETMIRERNVAGGCSSMLVSREAFIESGRFDPEMPAMQDWDLWLRLVRKFRIRVIDRELILYRDHSQGRISTDQQRRIEGLTRLLKKNEDKWPEHVRAFHRSRLACEACLQGTARWASIWQAQAPLASVWYLFSFIRRRWQQ